MNPTDKPIPGRDIAGELRELAELHYYASGKKRTLEIADQIDRLLAKNETLRNHLFKARDVIEEAGFFTTATIIDTALKESSNDR